MSALAASKVIGCYASIEANGLRINVKILDVKSSYGVTRYEVTPLNGTGEVWVNADRCMSEAR